MPRVSGLSSGLLIKSAIMPFHYLFFRGLLPAGQIRDIGKRPWRSRLFRRTRWWEPVPSGLRLYPRAQLTAVAPGPSRLIAVNPGWKHWRPPPATVH